jgi:hypothetical protein
MPEMSRIVAAMIMELPIEIRKLIHQTGLFCPGTIEKPGYAKRKSRSMQRESL